MNTILRVLILLALDFIVSASRAEGIGQFAGQLIEPVTILSNFVSTGSFIVGVMVLISALMRYMQYRVNPLAVPLSTVIVLLLLGIMLVALPFVYMLTGAGIPFSIFGSSHG